MLANVVPPICCDSLLSLSLSLPLPLSRPLSRLLSLPLLPLLPHLPLLFPPFHLPPSPSPLFSLQVREAEETVRDRLERNPMEPLLLKLAREFTDSQDLSDRLLKLYKVSLSLCLPRTHIPAARHSLVIAKVIQDLSDRLLNPPPNSLSLSLSLFLSLSQPLFYR